MTDQPKLPAGTYVRFRKNPVHLTNRVAMVVEQSGDVLLLLTEAGTTLCLRDEVTALRNQRPRVIVQMRTVLPYGKWTCADGREVLFNRKYEPIAQRIPGSQATSADADERVAFEREEWFYDDGRPPWRDRRTAQQCCTVLVDWGMPISGYQLVAP